MNPNAERSEIAAILDDEFPRLQPSGAAPAPEATLDDTLFAAVRRAGAAPAQASEPAKRRARKLVAEFEAALRQDERGNADAKSVLRRLKQQLVAALASPAPALPEEP